MNYGDRNELLLDIDIKQEITDQLNVIFIIKSKKILFVSDHITNASHAVQHSPRMKN